MVEKQRRASFFSPSGDIFISPVVEVKMAKHSIPVENPQRRDIPLIPQPDKLPVKPEPIVIPAPKPVETPVVKPREPVPAR